MKCKDGVVVAVEKVEMIRKYILNLLIFSLSILQPQISKMLVQGSNRRIFGVDAYAGLAVTGLPADGRQIVNRARDESQNYRETYGSRIVPSVLALCPLFHYLRIIATIWFFLHPRGVR